MNTNDSAAVSKKQIDIAEDAWIALVEEAITNGHQYVMIPRFALSEFVAKAVAGRLRISVDKVGRDYLFTSTPRDSQQLLGNGPTFH